MVAHKAAKARRIGDDSPGVAGERGQMRILVLGGTEEGRALSDQLVLMGHEVTTSFAGHTREPIVPKGDVHIGGFGGALGLAAFLRSNGYQRLVDATHPYSVKIATHAVHAAKAAAIPLVRLTRPEWNADNYDGWTVVSSTAEAANVLPRGARVLLTIGHRDIDLFMARGDCWFVVRTIEPIDDPLPPNATVVMGRPPYFLGQEKELMYGEQITHLVSKNSGGVQTEAKLQAAQQLNIPVVMIARPKLLPAPEALTVGRAIAALHLERP